jgi:hypothetical protein
MEPSMGRLGRTLFVAAMCGMALSGGCHGPSQANIELRKQNQQLRANIEDLNRRHEADLATIRGLQNRENSVPLLPQSELDQLFTTSGLKFGRLTGGDRPDMNLPGDTLLKVYVVPIDQQGDPIKAAGTFEVQLFDLALGSNNQLGDWKFDLQQTKADWYDSILMYSYVLPCPWQRVPTHSDLVARVTFRDQLTQRLFVVDRKVTVQPPQG